MDVDGLEELRAIAAGVLPGSGVPVVRRTENGTSTPVYGIERDGTTLYLRLAEGPEASLAPEVRAHELLLALGAKVPAVVHFDPFNERLQRSVMVTTEIPGEPIGANHHGIDVAVVIEAAGRDLAIINSIEVDGFGWIRRDEPVVDRLKAELPSLQDFALDDFDSHLAITSSFFSSSEIRTIRETVERNSGPLEALQACLAHGDFDVTHIYHRNGVYTGIIDFGEIRGVDRFYDLGHFALHDGETIPASLLPSLIDGYRDSASIAAGFEPRIHLWSLLIGLRALARSAGRAQNSYQRHLIVALRRILATMQHYD